MRTRSIIPFLLVLVLGACTKVINPNLPSTAPQLVILGMVTDTAGPYTVTVSQTVAVSSPSDNFPPVSGATVIITDSTAGIRETLTESSPGTYVTHTLQGVPGHLYGLLVLTAGQAYNAVSLMPLPVPLDSVGMTTSSRRMNKVNIIDPVLYFQDPASGGGHFYQFTETVNDSVIDRVFTFNDRLSVGRYISDELVNDSTYILPGSQVQLAMYCVDSSAYDYLKTLPNADGNGTVAAPANPITNLSGGALGYFSAQTVTTRTVIFN